MLLPLVLGNTFCISGTITIRPKNPCTIEGSPASRSTAGFKTLYKGGTEFGHERWRPAAQGNPHDDGAGGDINAAQNHGEDAVVVGVGPPAGAQQKTGRGRFPRWRDAVGKQVNADQRHGCDGDASGDQKRPPASRFHAAARRDVLCFFVHRIFTALLQKKGCKVTALSCVRDVSFS